MSGMIIVITFVPIHMSAKMKLMATTMITMMMTITMMVMVIIGDKHRTII